MKDSNKVSEKKSYQKPQLRIVNIRPREVLGSLCNNSVNTGPYPCDESGCAS